MGGGCSANKAAKSAETPAADPALADDPAKAADSAAPAEEKKPDAAPAALPDPVAVDPATAESKKLASLMGEMSELELKCWAGDAALVPDLKAKRAEVKELRDAGVKPSVGVLVFKQIDTNGSGTVEKGELKRMLNGLPKTKPKEGVKFVPFDELLATLDSDSSGDVDLEEWLTNLDKLEGLKTAMESVLDPDTGRLTTYRSYADQMAKEMGAIKKLEKSGGDEEAIQKKKDSVARFKENGHKPSAGVLVFDQIDVDGSGAIDRGELQTLLNKLPRKKPAPGVEFVPFEDMIKTFDADGNGTIEIDEWLNNLQKLPGIRMAIESVLDFDTGMLTVDLQQAEE
jgi:Ca2+-binding EF-hand superfamily protein